jgi:hypothetical protein
MIQTRKANLGTERRIRVADVEKEMSPNSTHLVLGSSQCYFFHRVQNSINSLIVGLIAGN